VHALPTPWLENVACLRVLCVCSFVCCVCGLLCGLLCSVRVCACLFKDYMKVSCASGMCSRAALLGVCVGMRHLVPNACECVQSVCFAMLRECARVVGWLRSNVVRGVCHTCFGCAWSTKELSAAGLEPATAGLESERSTVFLRGT